MKAKILKFLKILFSILWVTISLLVIYALIQTPSLDRDWWTIDQKILPAITFNWNIVDIQNIRNFKYNTTSDYQVNYYNSSFNLDDIESVYYIIEPFSTHDWPAHTMLSFWFKDNKYLTVSSEIRKEKWESFSPFWWLLNQFEMVYVIWDENDLIKLRANYRKDDVFMYPIKTDKENIKKLFVSAMQRADKLSKVPEFYNTLTNTCTTSILDHVNIIRKENNKEKISWSKKVFLPSHSDQIAYDEWLIDTKLPLEEARAYYKINELSEQYADSPDYSKMIRKEIK